MVPTSLNNWAFETFRRRASAAVAATSRVARRSAARRPSTPWSIFAERPEITNPGRSRARAAGPGPTSCPISSSRKPTRISPARCMARTARSMWRVRERTTPSTRSSCEAARQANFPVRDDFNGEEQEGCGLYQLTQKNGERWSAARAYLQPFMGRRAPICGWKPARRRDASCSTAAARSASNTSRAELCAAFARGAR